MSNNQEVKEFRKQSKIAIAALAVSLIGAGFMVAKALGFKSPEQTQNDTAAQVKALQDDSKDLHQKQSDDHAFLMVVNQKVDDQTEGMNRVLDAMGLQRIPVRKQIVISQQ